MIYKRLRVKPRFQAKILLVHRILLFIREQVINKFRLISREKKWSNIVKKIQGWIEK